MQTDDFARMSEETDSGSSTEFQDDESDLEFVEAVLNTGLDIRQGHRMANLFEKSVKKVSIFDRILGAWADVRYLMGFSSPIIAHYYLNVTECMIKRRVRRFLKLLVAFWCVLLIKSIRLPTTSMTNLTGTCILAGSLVLLYIYTFRRLSRKEYRFISLILMVGSLTYTLYESCRKDSALDGTYAYPSSLIMMIIIFLPLDIDLAIPILVIFCTIFVIISLRQMTFNKLKYTIYETTLKPLYYQLEVYDYYVVQDGFEMWAVFTEDYCVVQCTSWLIVLFLGVYLRFWNELRRRSAFSIIGKSARARHQVERALVDQSEWISAIMPVQVRDEYISMMRNKSTDAIWVFNKAFDNVTILFADIVGFTKMSSSKTATQIVMLLNDLYNRFDDLCTHLTCEKIGTLGDCYYAVAGCPVERKDHAMSCVELGLGMCRIIKVFNRENSEEVNMRVGVHTGRVNAAIIGCSRFRYDVYSTDVIVANEMETYGLPGRVHISHTTFMEVKDLYRFAKGPPLPIVKEQQLGMGGLEQVEVEMKTYFVDPLSSLIRKKGEKFGQTGAPSRILTLENTRASEAAREDGTITTGTAEGHTETQDGQAREKESHFGSSSRFWGNDAGRSARKRNLRDIRHVQLLREDPKEQVKLFRYVPLTQLFNRFQQREIEKAFQSYMQGYVPCVTIESPRLAPVIDAIIISLVTFTMLGSFMLSLNDGVHDYFSLGTIICVVFIAASFLVTVTFTYGFVKHTANVTPRRGTRYRIFANFAFREAVFATLTLIPTATFMCLFLITDTPNSPNVQIRVLYLEFGTLCILLHCMATSSSSWARLICIIVSTTCFFATLLSLNQEYDFAYCESLLWYMKKSTDLDGRNEHLVGAITLASVVHCITMDNERSMRLWYYVLREAEAACGTARREKESAQQLLDNVIPPYIFTQLAMRGHRRLKAGTFCFANSVQDVAVSFATLTNFFKSYYREDYRGGEGALKLLNTIICEFDNLMKQPQFASVEKIKTVNDCYMIAAGLNQIQRETQVPADRHIFELMDFCFALYATLNQINEKYIIGSDKFQMKIGYYVGDVTAGIIGSRKPIYDIWGNTVNVASRMYSTGSSGQIQTTREVTERLGDRYNYEYRGHVFVKGKGEMLTYFVHKKGFSYIEESSSDEI